MDFVKAALNTKRLIAKNGRDITLYKLDRTVADVTKPWKGSAAPTLGSPYVTKGVFAVPATSIPTESRGLAYDWVSKDLLTQARHVILVAAYDAPDLREYNAFSDTNGLTQAIIWGQLLQPGPVGLLYVFGTRE